MRKTAKALGLVVVSIVGTFALAIGSAFTAALAFGATALIVPGTGTPNAANVADYMQNARDYYLGGTACANGGCTDADLHSIVYPASFFPLAFIPNWCVPGRCDKWDDSVQDGVADLDMQLNQALADPDEQIVIFGYSQGGAVVTNELLNLRGKLSDADKARIQVVVIGNVDNPAGGLFTRLGFLGTIPFFDVTTGLATPIDTGLPITSVRFEYDGVSDAPKYFGNPLAVANALAGFAYIHATYLDPNQNGQFTGLPNDYTPAQLATLIDDPANATYDAARNKYILIPTKTLPFVRPFLDLAAASGTTALVKPVVDLISPVLRVLIDLGYDRNENPGVNSPLSVLPFSLSTNPIQVGLDLVAAVIQGIQDAAAGGAVTVAPRTTPTAPSTLTAAGPQTQQRSAPMLVPNASTAGVETSGSAAPPDSVGVADESGAPDNVVTLPGVVDQTPKVQAPVVGVDDGAGSVDDVPEDGVDKLGVDKDVTQHTDLDVDKVHTDKTADKVGADSDVTKDTDKVDANKDAGKVGTEKDADKDTATKDADKKDTDNEDATKDADKKDTADNKKAA